MKMSRIKTAYGYAHSHLQEDASEWKYLLDNIDKFEFTILSNGNLEARFIDQPFDDIAFRELLGFSIGKGEFNPLKDIRKEVKKWLERQLEESVINTI